jgi:protein-L-isoaspartate(D-aspartate) O-methyltransferase
VITVEGGVEILPDSACMAQLKDGGRIGAIFMDGAVGTVKIGYKRQGRITWRSAFNATAPLLDGFRKVAGLSCFRPWLSGPGRAARK